MGCIPILARLRIQALRGPRINLPANGSPYLGDDEEQCKDTESDDEGTLHDEPPKLAQLSSFTFWQLLRIELHRFKIFHSVWSMGKARYGLIPVC